MSGEASIIGGGDGSQAGATTIDVEAEVAAIAGSMNVLNARLVEVIEHAIRGDELIGHGIHSPAQWLTYHAGLSPQHANEIVRVAEQRSAFPTVIEAFDRGEIGIDQVHVVVTRAPAWADDQVAHFAKNATVQQLRRAIRDEYFDGDPDQPQPDPGDQPDRDRLSTQLTETDRWRINGELDADSGTIIDTALAEARDSLFEHGHTDVTWAHALVEIAQRSLDSITSPSRRERFKTWIHLEAATGHASLTNGWRIPLAIRDHLLCDGQIQPVWEHDGIPFSVGRSQRIVPDRTRRIIEHRDQGCRVPGCTATRYVEIHHIIHWLNGGPTDTWNLLSLCPKHHRMHHHGRLGITGNADHEHGVTFTDRTGRTIAPNGQPTLPTRPPPRPTGNYIHPSGERLDMNWIGLGWAHDNALEHRRRQARTTQHPDLPDRT